LTQLAFIIYYARRSQNLSESVREVRWRDGFGLEVIVDERVLNEAKRLGKGGQNAGRSAAFVATEAANIDWLDLISDRDTAGIVTERFERILGLAKETSRWRWNLSVKRVSNVRACANCEKADYRHRLGNANPHTGWRNFN
jgi:hypothetical protein